MQNNGNEYVSELELDISHTCCNLVSPPMELKKIIGDDMQNCNTMLNLVAMPVANTESDENLQNVSIVVENHLQKVVEVSHSLNASDTDYFTIVSNS